MVLMREMPPYAKQTNFDPNVLVAARLAPDQYELVRQMQAGCDAAKYAAAYLSGGTAPYFSQKRMKRSFEATFPGKLAPESLLP